MQTLTDTIFGKALVTEPVLIDLIGTESMKRLQHISQFGVPDSFYHIKNFSRYEHSVGVFVLLRNIGADLEEQIDGLLHDVSHKSFSHIYDWVIGEGGDELFQDKNHNHFIQNTEIPQILSRHGYDTSILDKNKHTLLEQEIPNLCADRADYVLREIYYRKDMRFAQWCARNLLAHDGKMVFTSKKPAKAFAMSFLQLQSEHWGGRESRLRYRFFANALNTALKEKIIFPNDFDTTDAQIMEKISASSNPEVVQQFHQLEKRTYFNPHGKTKMELPKKKLRYTDPLYMENGAVLRLSETDRQFRAIMEKYIQKSKEPITVRFDFI